MFYGCSLVWSFTLKKYEFLVTEESSLLVEITIRNLMEGSLLALYWHDELCSRVHISSEMLLDCRGSRSWCLFMEDCIVLAHFRSVLCDGDLICVSYDLQIWFGCLCDSWIWTRDLCCWTETQRVRIWVVSSRIWLLHGEMLSFHDGECCGYAFFNKDERWSSRWLEM